MEYMESKMQELMDGVDEHARTNYQAGRASVRFHIVSFILGFVAGITIIALIYLIT